MRNPETDRLVTDRLTLEFPAGGMAERLLDYRQRNRDHLRPWEPERPYDFYTIEAMAGQLDRMRRHIEEQT
ncbi:MAG TPA: 30S ribosomal protein S5 alanine N-acetyltransferase, partial [Duganella sp.]